MIGDPLPDCCATRVRWFLHAGDGIGPAGTVCVHALRVRRAVGRRRRHGRSRRDRRGGRMGRTVRLGAGVGCRRVDLPRRGGDAHLEDPSRHDAHPAVAAPTVGAGQPGRHGRPPVGGPGHAVGRTRCDRQRVRRLRRGVRPARPRRVARRVPRHRHRPVGWAAVQLRRQALHGAADGVPDHRQHVPGAARPDLVRRDARPSEVDGPSVAVGRTAAATGGRRAPDAGPDQRDPRASSATATTTS